MKSKLKSRKARPQAVKSVKQRPPAVKSTASCRRKVQAPAKSLALITVSDKTSLEFVARSLVDLGYEVVSTGGTYKALQKAGIPCLPIEQVSGVPELLDGRVKTLGHKVSAGVLAKRSMPEHMQQLRVRRIRTIDVVIANLYPFAQTVARPGATREDIVENIDIGGVTLLRAAAKNCGEGVIVIGNPADYPALIAALQKGRVSGPERMEWAKNAFRQTAAYDATIWEYFSAFFGEPGQALLLEPFHTMRKAENDYQGPSVLCRNLLAPVEDPLAWTQWQFVEGNPGHVNLCGADSALRVMCRLAEACRVNFFGRVPYIAIACKHGNPCGLGVDWDNPILAIERTMAGDKDAVMGAEVMCNFFIGDKEAIRIHTVLKSMREKAKRDLWGVDVVCASGFNEGAVSLLSTRSTGRHLLANPAMANPVLSLQDYEVRLVRGGALVQKPANFIFDSRQVYEWHGSRQLNEDELLTLLIAWVVAWEGVSNSMALAKDLMLLAAGLGQQDRRGGTKLLLTRAKDAENDVRESLFASDGFFPFAVSKQDELSEAIEILVAAGCIGGVVPADGKRWPEVSRFIDQSGLIVAALDPKFRGFAKH